MLKSYLDRVQFTVSAILTFEDKEFYFKFREIVQYASDNFDTIKMSENLPGKPEHAKAKLNGLLLSMDDEGIPEGQFSLNEFDLKTPQHLTEHINNLVLNENLEIEGIDNIITTISLKLHGFNTENLFYPEDYLKDKTLEGRIIRKSAI